MNRLDRVDCSQAAPVHGRGANTPGVFHRHADVIGLILSLLLLATAIVLVGYRLFAGITTVGMTGVDTFDYWRVANDFLHGHYDSEYHRLSFYALNALALKLLGTNDYAIRAFIGGFALLNIALVYLLVHRIAGNAAIALATAVLYAFNPIILIYAGTELPHITGATFVLLCALLVLNATDQNAAPPTRAVASLLAGMSLAAAALTHEDLAFLGFGYVITIAIALGTSTTRDADTNRWCNVAFAAGLFVVGAAAAAACLTVGFALTPGKMVNDFFSIRDAFDANTAVRTGGDFFTTVAVRMLRNFTLETIGRVATGLAVVVAVIVPIAFFLRRSERLQMLLTLEIPVLVFIAGFLVVAQIYLEGTYQRLFIPLIGPTLAFATSGAYLLLRPFLRWGATAMIAAWATFVVVHNKPWNFPPPGASAHRQLYNAVEDRVTSQRKLLLPACYAIGYPWVGIASPVYLDGNVVPVYLLRDFISLDALIAANQVGYVYVPETPLPGMWPREQIERLFSETYGVAMDRALLDSLPRVSQQVWRGDTRVEWSRETCAYEAQTLRRLLDQRGARVALTVPGMGDVYALAR